MSEGETSHHANSEPTPSGTSPRESARRWAAITLAFVGLCISGYLAWLTLTGRVAPGCGSGAGCGEVLGSRWSGIGPVPVSMLAVAAYLLVLTLLVVRPFAAGVCKLALCAAGVALIGAAAWYIAVQALLIEAWCLYCLGGHGVGVVLGLVLLAARPMRDLVVPVRLGVPTVLILIAIQAAIPASGKRIGLPSGSDFDVTDATGRHLGLLGGKLQVDAADTPHHGPTDGRDVIVLVLDYACPHCREAHEMLEEQFSQRDGLVVFALPASLHEDHNPHLPLDHERFDHSYELALLSLAVWRAAPERWPAFDRWLFEGQPRVYDETRWPRTLEAAETRAADLIGRNAVAGAYTDADLLAQVDRNIDAIGDVLAASPHAATGLPIALAPHAEEAVYGRFDEPGLLDQLLEAARTNR